MPGGLTFGSAEAWRPRLSFAFLTVTLLWMALLVAAPWVSGHGVGGRPALVASAGVYVTGSLVCHQRPERSFSLWGVQMPVCARCAGLYLGGAFGVLIAGARRRRGVDAGRARLARWIVLATAVPTGITVIGEWAGWFAPAGEWRALTGVPLGAAVTWVASLAIRGELE